jgi:fatty acid synthase
MPFSPDAAPEPAFTRRQPLPGSLAARLAPERVLLTFAGQGAPCLDELAALREVSPWTRRAVALADAVIAEHSQHPTVRRSGRFAEPLTLRAWLDDPATRPGLDRLVQSHISHPIVFLTQLGRAASLVEQDLDLSRVAGCVGHSQGMLAALAWSTTGGAPPSDAALRAQVAWVFWQGFWSQGGRPAALTGPFMVSVAGPPLARLEAALERFNAGRDDDDRVWLAVRNTPNRAVLSGLPHALAGLRRHLDGLRAADEAARKARQRGGAPLTFQWEVVPVGAPFHVPLQQAMRDEMATTAAAMGLGWGPLRLPVFDAKTGERMVADAGLAGRVLDRQFLDPVDWTGTISRLAETCRPTHVIDVGPDVGVARLTASVLRGRGVPVIAAAEPAGQEALFTVGARPPEASDWSVYAPVQVTLPDGAVAVETRYTRLTGHAPIILAGMTPTTVDVGIVAAAANAGFTAELAGGGQVTAEVFERRMAELSDALAPGVEVVFNALLLDPWLYDLHLGAHALVLHARRAGRPLRGVTLSGGVPDAEAGAALLRRLAAAGLHHNAFKPGSVAQVDAVLQIVDLVPDQTVYVHLECGKAGGHHGWDDLEEVLLARYARLRERANVVLCVGGGVADPARAAALLSGRWSVAHGYPPMPTDAVFLGTVAMACAEATATPSVKAALVRASGADAFVGAGKVAGGVTSGRSGLDADIHYLENRAAACARLLDEVAGDDAKVQARRDELIAALAGTAKPYFGDVAAMTYGAIVDRLVELMAIGGPDGPWPDPSWRARVADAVRRAEARLAPDAPRVIADADLDDPAAALAALRAAVPDVDRAVLHPHDVDWFVALCSRRGKPVPFVPVLDANVRRWFTSDALWQAQHPAYDADAVLVIPGPAAIAGVTRADEPVADLLCRFEAGIAATLSGPAVARAGRLAPRPARGVDRRHHAGHTVLRAAPGAPATALCDAASGAGGLLGALFAADRISVGGARVENPARRMFQAGGGASLTLISEVDGPADAPHQARYTRGDEVVTAHVDGERVVLTLPGDVALTLDTTRRPEGIVFYVAPAAWRAALLGLYTDAGATDPVAADADHAEAVDLPAERRAAWAALAGGPSLDLAYVAAWRPILACLTGLGDGAQLLRLVHLDHAVEGTLPAGPATATARLVSVIDTPAGRTLEVEARVAGDDAAATLRERFFIRDAVAAPGRAVRRRLQRTTRPLTDADVAFLADLPGWSWRRPPAPGEVLHVDAELSLRPTPHGEAVTAVGVVTVSGEVVADLALDEVRSTDRSDQPAHPVEAALDLLAPPTAGAPRPVRTLGERVVVAPAELATWAEVGGDHNPLHTSPAIARLAGLDGPIVHGMWTSARLAAFTAEVAADGDAARLTAWSVRFLGVVWPGESLRLRVTRVGVRAGAARVEATVHALRADGDALVATASGEVRAPTTVVVFPGQGVQRAGMGMDGFARSRAARAAWERADAFTRSHLGFSILQVVRDNPATLRAGRDRFHHPEGVLHLTRFTQVALAVLAAAQVAELRSADVLPSDALFAGHSIGEYNALGVFAELFPLEVVVELVYQRGAAMETQVPRDADGVTGYGMIAARAVEAGLDEAGLAALIAGLRAERGVFLEIVNYNVRGLQYAIAGDTAGLAALEAALQARTRPGGKPVVTRIPGVDVPFHSSRLAAAVPAFRATLERALPATVPWRTLVGRYIPNLVARPFSLEPEFIDRVVAASGAEALRSIVPADDLARALLIELLAWQFASPVRWIETQDLLFTPREAGGLGATRLIEVGVGASPTVRNMAGQTLSRWPGPRAPAVTLLHVEADADAVWLRDGDAPVAAPTEVPPAAPPAPDAARPTPTAAAPQAAAPHGAPSDEPLPVALGLSALLALLARVRLDQLRDDDTIDGLCDGVSARRNQVLLDLGAEFAVGVIDGAHERPLRELTAELTARASGWRGPGPFLRGAVDEAVRRLLGPAGLTARDAGEWLATSWGLGPGLTAAALVHLTLLGRAGAATRGGSLGAVTPCASRAEAHAALDAAVAALGAWRGAPIVRAAAPAEAAVDSAALAALRHELLGPDGVLAAPLRALAGRLDLPVGDPGLPLSSPDLAAARLAAVDAESGPTFLDQVAPAFDARRHVRLDHAAALARRDLVSAVWDLAAGRVDGAWVHRQLDRLLAFGEDPAFAATAGYLAGRVADTTIAARLRAPVLSEPVDDSLADLVEALLREGAVTDASARDDLATAWRGAVRQPLTLRGQTALVTGAAPGSIAWEAVRHLLRGGARVIATSSSLDADRIDAWRALYRDAAGPGAELHLVPFNQASRRDVDALIDWLFSRVTEPDGATVRELKPAFAVDLLLPFAARSTTGTLDTLTPAEDVGLRTLLLGVEALIAGLARRYAAEGPLPDRCHVLLPLSPNHGLFGGDGLYGEAKAALEVLPARWRSEPSWSRAFSLCAATIGWVRGTGLMAANDAVADAVERGCGARTFSAEEMGWLLASACAAPLRARACEAPLRLDLSGGLSDAVDLPGVVGRARAEMRAAEAAAKGAAALRAAYDEAVGAPRPASPTLRLPPPPGPATRPGLVWPATPTVDLARVVVVVGYGELGPWGSSRTRRAIEVDDRLDAAGVLELAWVTGLVRYDPHHAGGAWIDAASGEPVPEADLAARYEAAVRTRAGVRMLDATAAGYDPTAVPMLQEVHLTEPFTFEVPTEDDARSFLDADPAHTRVARAADGRLLVTRTAGAVMRVPRAVRLSRRVAGAVPDGFDPARYGVPPELIGAVDRLSLMNLLTTADAFASAGLEPEELLRWVHPTRVANTQGSGIGGMTSIRRLYTDLLLGQPRQGDILQETLGNVVAAWVVQAYVGSYGGMTHPVAACATAAVSVEVAVDKLLAGRADVVVAGGFDDVGAESVVGFGDMHATADTDTMLAMGLRPSEMSRANDVRRRGFVEAQGGGTLLLARGDVAARMGLPVRAVVGWAGSFGDGVHASIPAPGIGVLAAAQGGRHSPLGRALSDFGLTADDVAVVYKHDTSTAANDPNEAEVHQRIQDALGRSAGNPLVVVSQKTVTGHAKGGAAAWQLIGLAQTLEEGVIPGNRNLTCLDAAMSRAPTLLHTDAPMRPGPCAAGLLTSLGFGHVSSLILLLHPAAFAAALPDDLRAAWVAAAAAREEIAARRTAEVCLGRRPAFRRRAHRRLDGADAHAAEVRMLLDPDARLGPDGVYVP